MKSLVRMLCAVWLVGMAGVAAASEYHGQVLSGGLPVPGATVTATQGAKKLMTVSDEVGGYSFADLPDGTWTITVELQGFAAEHGDVSVAANAPAGKWELTLLGLEQMTALSKVVKAAPMLPAEPVAASRSLPGAKPDTKKADAPVAMELPKPADDSQRPSDGFLINGSSQNAATSQFSLAPAFGNGRSGTKSLYTGGVAAIFDNSSFDARPYSLSGLETPKDSYNRITGSATIGGPIRIPHVLPRGPNFFVSYQWTRNSSAATETGLVPTAAERTGNLAEVVNSLGQPVPIYSPATGVAYPANVVPVSAQAAALLALYPLPNIPATGGYNYQAPVLDSSHTDDLQTRLDKSIGRKDQVYGGFALSSSRASNENLFGYVDATDTLGINTNVNWTHRFSQRLFVSAAYRFSRQRTRVVPQFEDRANVAGAAGVTGDLQDPTYWGPPTLTFSSGISTLSDAESAFNRNRTDAFSGSAQMYRGRHNVSVGGDLRKQEYNDLFQQDPRGTFTFTGAATEGAAASAAAASLSASGSDLADFLIGVPDTSSIAFGNADKYLRQNVYDLYANDDWRVMPALTVNAGLRWEYGAPITELKGRLVNLDVAPGFTAVAPVLANAPVGTLTGTHYPAALIRPDRLGFEPRVGISWRPIPASTIVVRAGYGVYHDTSVYQSSALQLAQQAPLSKSLEVSNSAACPLTLANGFTPCATVTQDLFAVDPDFRVGYAQTWQLSVQRDLPGAMQGTVTYLGVKGTRGLQKFLPNTYPLGGVNPCPACPSGYVYETSNGDSTRESGQVQLRRRLRNGFTASALYTYSHSIDDDSALGGQGHVTSSSTQQTSAAQSTSFATPTIAQNWLNLSGERGRSNFDQRHLLNLTAQYTSGQGLGGGTLMSGWRGHLVKEWTVLTQIVVGSGLPETPIYLAATPGSGFTGTIRPDATGASIYKAAAGLHLNDAAYTAPVAGQWGTAGRNSIEGPGTFTLNTSLARTFRPTAKLFLDARVDATNLLNHAVFTGWNSTVNSTQFGLPLAANPMRSLQTTLRLRF